MENQKKTNTTCPIKAAKAITPWWMMEIYEYDGLEIHPVRDHSWNDETMGPGPFCIPVHRETRCEICEPETAHFWSVYGHCPYGGDWCFEDFPTHQEARAFAERLPTVYPHLKEFGLLDDGEPRQLDLFSETL